MKPVQPSRRRFLVRAGVVATLPFVAAVASVAVQAQALKRLPLDNPQAKALAYTEDASQVQHPSFKPGSSCSNCQFFTAANEGCTLFAGFSVAPKGWCAAWAKKA